MKSSGVQECVTMTKELTLEMWFGGENKSFNAEFVWNNNNNNNNNLAHAI
jgi:hypothetical protein